MGASSTSNLNTPSRHDIPEPKVQIAWPGKKFGAEGHGPPGSRHRLMRDGLA